MAGSDPETALRAIQNFQALAQNWEVEAENAVLRAQSGRKTSAPSDDAVVQEWTRVIGSQLGVDSPDNYVGQMIEQSGIELSAPDITYLKEFAWRNRGLFYAQGPEGQLLGNDQRLTEELNHQIALLQRTPSALKAEAVKAQNQKAVDGKPVPPARAAKGKAGVGAGYVPPKDKAEYRKRMGSND